MGERCARHGCCCWIPLFAYRHNRCSLLVAALLRQRASEGEREAMAITTATMVSAAITPPCCTSSLVAAISSTSSTQTLMPPRYSTSRVSLLKSSGSQKVKQKPKWKPQADGYNVEFQVPWLLGNCWYWTEVECLRITKVRDVDKQMTLNVKRICKDKYFFRSLSTLYRLSDCRPWRIKQAGSWSLRFLAVCANRRRSVVVLWSVPSHLTNLLKEFEFLIRFTIAKWWHCFKFLAKFSLFLKKSSANFVPFWGACRQYKY